MWLILLIIRLCVRYNFFMFFSFSERKDNQPFFSTVPPRASNMAVSIGANLSRRAHTLRRRADLSRKCVMQQFCVCASLAISTFFRDSNDPKNFPYFVHLAHKRTDSGNIIGPKSQSSLHTMTSILESMFSKPHTPLCECQDKISATRLFSRLPRIKVTLERAEWRAPSHLLRKSMSFNPEIGVLLAASLHANRVILSVQKFSHFYRSKKKNMLKVYFTFSNNLTACERQILNRIYKIIHPIKK